MFGFNIFSFSLLCSMIAIPGIASSSDWPDIESFPDITPSINLTWSPCFTSYNCSRLDVPLDYLKPNGSRSSIPLVKLPATSTPYKGIILINPGGPGDAGITFLLNIFFFVVKNPALSSLQALRSNYDLVSWDPRGVGLALPTGSCDPPDNSTSSSNATIPTLKRVKQRSYNKIYGPEGLNVNISDSKYTSMRKSSAQCQAQIGGVNEIGPHMSTASVVRDMITILDAFSRSEDGSKCEDASLLNYWGISYGSFLGETFASMFPDRVGRVVLDGVMDPDDWITGAHFNGVTDADDEFSTFFLYCHLAGPSQCPFYTGVSPHDIYLRFESILLRLNSTHAMEQGWQNASEIDSTLKRLRQNIIFEGLYNPIQTFPHFGKGFAAIDAALTNSTNTTLDDIRSAIDEIELAIVEEQRKTPAIAVLGDFTPSSFPGVACSDNGGALYNLTAEELQPRFKAYQEESYLGGGANIQNAMRCVSWPIVTNYRYTGSFGGKTKNPILFVSNVLDPVTPISNARKGAGLFSGAQLLTIEGIGHSSLGSFNRCAFSKISAFFDNGTLPGKDIYCPPEAGPWNITIPGSLEKRIELSKIRNSIRTLREK